VATVDNLQGRLFTFDILERYGCNTLQGAVNRISRNCEPSHLAVNHA
jgi:hypothetical protein